MHVQRPHLLALALAAAAAVTLSGCGGGDGASPTPRASATPKAAATPSPTFDQATVNACNYAKKGIAGDGQASFQATKDAMSSAELSDVPALRDVAAKYASDGTEAGNVMANAGAMRIETWCLQHGFG